MSSNQELDPVHLNENSLDFRVDGILGVTTEDDIYPLDDITTGNYAAGHVIDSKKPDIGDIELRDYGFARGLLNVEVGSTGSIKTPLESEYACCLYNSKVLGDINGDLEGSRIFKNSEVAGKVKGDVKAWKKFAVETDNLTVFGDIVVQKGRRSNSRIVDENAIFDESNLPKVVGEKVSGPKLNNGSVGGLIVSDEVEILDYNENMTVVTPRNPKNNSFIPNNHFYNVGLTPEDEDWLDFKQKVKEKSDEIWGIPIISPNDMLLDEETRSSLEDGLFGGSYEARRFFVKEKQMQEILNEELSVDPRESMNLIAERIDNLEAFGTMEDRRYASLLDHALSSKESEADKLGKLGEVLDGEYHRVDRDAKGELLQRLDNQDIFETANSLDYESQDTLTCEIEELITSESEITDVSDQIEDLKNWESRSDEYINLGEALEEAVEEHSDDLANLSYLAEFLKEEFQLETAEWIVKQGEEDSDFPSEQMSSEIEERLEEEIVDKKRSLTKKSLKKLSDFVTLSGDKKSLSHAKYLTKEKQTTFIEFEGTDQEWAEYKQNLIWAQGIIDNKEHILSYEGIHGRFKNQILEKLIYDTANEDDHKKRKVKEFGETLACLEDGYKDELFEILKNEKDDSVARAEKNEHVQRVQYSDGEDKFGNTIFDIAVNREFDFFLEDESSKIEELIDTEGSLPDADTSDFESDSPYLEVIEELTSSESLEDGKESEYGEMSDQELAEKMKMVDGLAERIGIQYDASNVFDILKDKEGRRNNTKFEPGTDRIESLIEDRRKELEKDVQNKLREYTKQNIKRLGIESALEEYEEATGERVSEIDELDKNEIAALKIRKRFRSRKADQVDKLLNHKNRVYELDRNKKWLETHGFDKKDLLDPNLPAPEDEGYMRPDDPNYDSELKVEVDQSDVEIDVESEKRQYWDEVTELLESVGVETEVGDIEEAEKAVNELDEPEDEQDFRELKDAIDNYRSVDNRLGGVPDELRLRVANPMDTTRMGQGFGSCHDVNGGTFAWASVSNALDANKMVFYAEDEQGRERARVKAFITEHEEMIYHSTSQYKDTDIDTSEYFERYMEVVSNQLGLNLKHSSEADGWKERTKLLEAGGWYPGS